MPASAGGGRKPAAPGVEEREGPMRFFGLDARARLMFEDQRLASGRFEVETVSPHSFAMSRTSFAGSATGACARASRRPRACAIGSERATVHTFSSAASSSGRDRAHGMVARTVTTVPPSPAAASTRQMGVALPPTAAPAAGPDTVSLSGSDSLSSPVVIEVCRPVRPEAARNEGIFGRVTVQVLVDVDGRVVDAQVVRGIAALDQAALECARRYRFQPYRSNGRLVRFRYELPVTFLLD